MLAGIEIVTDRHTGKPDHQTGARIAEEALRRGLSMNIVKLPGMGGVFRIAPPLSAFRKERRPQCCSSGLSLAA